MLRKVYKGPDRRKLPRIDARFVVSYRILKGSASGDVTQTKNLSSGGLLITTNKGYEDGAVLEIKLRLPFESELINIIARVIDSKAITEGLIYDTRVEFQGIDEKTKKSLDSTVEFYLKKVKQNQA